MTIKKYQNIKTINILILSFYNKIVAEYYTNIISICISEYFCCNKDEKIK